MFLSLFLTRYVGIGFIMMANSIYNLNNNIFYLIPLFGSIILMFFGFTQLMLCILFVIFTGFILKWNRIKQLYDVSKIGITNFVNHINDITDKELQSFEPTEIKHIKIAKKIFIIGFFLMKLYYQTKRISLQILSRLIKFINKCKIDKAIYFALDIVEIILSYVYAAGKELLLNIPFIGTIINYKQIDLIPKTLKDNINDALEETNDTDKIDNANQLNKIEEFNINEMNKMMAEMNQMMKNIPDMMKIAIEIDQELEDKNKNKNKKLE